MEKIPQTIDYFIDTLEEAFEEFSSVVLRERGSKCVENLSRATKTPFPGINMEDESSMTEIPMLDAAESEFLGLF